MEKSDIFALYKRFSNLFPLSIESGNLYITPSSSNDTISCKGIHYSYHKIGPLVQNLSIILKKDLVLSEFIRKLARQGYFVDEKKYFAYDRVNDLVKNICYDDFAEVFDGFEFRIFAMGEQLFFVCDPHIIIKSTSTVDALLSKGVTMSSLTGVAVIDPTSGKKIGYILGASKRSEAQCIIQRFDRAVTEEVDVSTLSIEPRAEIFQSVLKLIGRNYDFETLKRTLTFLSQQRNFTLLVVTIIAAVSIIVAFLVFSWNRRLETTVSARTAELKTANEQLKVHDKMQKEFINIASHEMKTPTQAILGYSKLIQRHPEKREEMIQAISRNATRLQRLTNDILDVTRIESQSLRLNMERFNLNEVISDVVEDYKSEIEKSNSDIELLYYPGGNNALFIEGDRGRITQVISNLVSNAIKFTKKGGTVSITEKERIVVDNGNSNQVVVSIEDTGQGIDPEIFPRLFSKFAAKSDTGTGLGLFISKSIVEAHGGKIWAENNNGKEGATFAFTLSLSILQKQKEESSSLGGR